MTDYEAPPTTNAARPALAARARTITSAPLRDQLPDHQRTPRSARPAGRPGTASGSGGGPGGGPGGGWGEGAPPGADVVGHLRDLLRQAPVALAAALLAALVVGLVSGAADPVYRATATAVVEPGDAGDTGDPESAARLAATFVAAGTDPAVLSAASANTGWSESEAADRVSVALGEETGVIEVSARGASPEQASRVASAVVPALQTAVRADRQAQQESWTASLTQQLQQVQAQEASAAAGSADQQRLAADVDVRLQQISRIQRAAPPGLSQPAPAVAAPGAVSPKPLRDASLAFLVTALVVAELSALVAGRTGLTLGRSAARRLARRGRGSYHEVPREPSGAAAVLPLRRAVGDALAAGRQVVVLAGSGVSRAEAAALVLESSTQGPGPDADGAPDGLREEPQGGLLVAADLAEPWWRHVDASHLGMCVVVAPLAAPVRQLAAEATAAVASAGASVHVVALTTGSRGFLP